MKSFPAFPLLLSLLTAFPAAGQPIMSEIWQRHWNDGQLFDPQNPHHHPDADPDNDGWTNATEAIAGTSPFDANPPHGFLRLDIRHVPAVWVVDPLEEEPLLQSPEGFEIQCIEESTPGKAYQLFFSEDLSSNSWIAVGSPIPGAGDGITLVVHPQYEDHDPFSEEDPLLPPRGFWRLAISETFQDLDSDGLMDSDEWLLGSSPWLADTDDNGIDDLTQYQSGQPPAGDGADHNGDGIPDNELYFVEFEVVQESRGPGVHFLHPPLTGDTDIHRYLTAETSEIYSMSGSPRYATVANGQHKVTYSSLDDGVLTADIGPSEEGKSFYDWMEQNEITPDLGQGESLQWDPAQHTTTNPVLVADRHEVTTTSTRNWKIRKNDNILQSGTETRIVTHRLLLKDPVTWQQLWNQYFKALPWNEGAPDLHTPISGMEHHIGTQAWTFAAQIIRERYRQGHATTGGMISHLGAGGTFGPLYDTRLKSLRWRWVRFDPRKPFTPEVAAPPAAHERTVRLLVRQQDWLGEINQTSISFHDESKGIVEIKCKGGLSGWRSVPMSVFSSYRVEDPEYLEDMDFSKATYSHVTYGTLPVELLTDMNNDGRIDHLDRPLRDAALADGASGEIRDKGTEFMFVNDQLSNGLWDVEDEGATSYSWPNYGNLPGPPPAHKKDDDVEKIKISAGGLNTGVLWFSHSAISDMQFFKSAECLPGDSLGRMDSLEPYDLSSGALPEFIYLRVDPGSHLSAQRGGKLQMHIGETVEDVLITIELRLTVVRHFGAKDYFNAARDYILENNTRVFIREVGYPLLATDPSRVFRLCIMREEATTMKAFDAFSGGHSGIEMAYAGLPAVPRIPAVIINGNQCFWTAGWDESNEFDIPHMLFNIADKCHGRVIRGSVTAPISSDNFDRTTKPAAGSPLAGPDPIPAGLVAGPDGISGTADDIPNPDAGDAGGKYAGHNAGAWVFSAGQAGGADALGGLSTNYASVDRQNKAHQMIGYAKGLEPGKGCIFTATQIKGVGNAPAFKADAHASGVPALSPSADPGAIKLFILDSGMGSLALMHIDPSGNMRKAYMGRKTVWGVPYYVNNYLALDPEPSRP